MTSLVANLILRVVALAAFACIVVVKFTDPPDLTIVAAIIGGLAFGVTVSRPGDTPADTDSSGS